MQVEALEDVLRWTGQFHKQLSACLDHCADRHLQERASLLLDFLSRHEAQLSTFLGTFARSSASKVLHTWCYEYLDKKPIVQNRHCDAPFSELDTRQIIEVILEQHEQVIDLYRYLLSRAETPEVRELLQSLVGLEEGAVMSMVEGANRLEDI